MLTALLSVSGTIKLPSMRWLLIIFCISACSPVIDYGGVVKDAGRTIANVARDTSAGISNMFGGSSAKKAPAKQAVTSQMPNMQQASTRQGSQTAPQQQMHAHTPNYRPPSTIHHRMPSPLAAYYDKKPVDRTSDTSAVKHYTNTGNRTPKPHKGQPVKGKVATTKEPAQIMAKAIPPIDVQRSQRHLIYRPAVTP